MKFPRNARIFRGQLDTAPFAGVFFLLVIFLLLATLVYTPGFQIDLPLAPSSDLAGIDGPAVAVAVDPNGQFYFQNQLVQENELKRRLREAAQKSPGPLILVIEADKSVKYETLVKLAGLARDSRINISKVFWETLPRVFDAPNESAILP